MVRYYIFISIIDTLTKYVEFHQWCEMLLDWFWNNATIKNGDLLHVVKDSGNLFNFFFFYLTV